ncbi:MAG TPA: sulfatase-like hydrolase/transferase [Chitinophagaceae bacterium]|nr:sulfatase-like hydrolase/transferase [Chitinophagaceae bacterium]
MKHTFLFLTALVTSAVLYAQGKRIENIIIITTDGYRWEDVFKGIDSAIADNKEYNQNRAKEIYKRFGAVTPEESRQKLLPFMWGTIARQGQLYGNRLYDSKVDNANPYWFSYPGYSEIFCGYADTAVNSNSHPANANTNILEFLNKQPAFAGKVASFASWGAFASILNEKRSGFPVYCGIEPFGDVKDKSAELQLLNDLRADSYHREHGATPDMLTQYSAMYYLKAYHPKVLSISYGETDERAHEGKYLDYLEAMHSVDKWIGDLWNYIQRTPQYKDKTALFITVDHGRGDRDKTKWTSHGNTVEDSHEIWFAVMGPGIKTKGEVKEKGQYYQEQFAQTIAELLGGYEFKCEHPVGKGFSQDLVK